MALQERNRAFDKPITPPDPAAASYREGTPRHAGQPHEGTMGERQNVPGQRAGTG